MPPGENTYPWRYIDIEKGGKNLLQGVPAPSPRLCASEDIWILAFVFRPVRRGQGWEDRMSDIIFI